MMGYRKLFILIGLILVCNGIGFAAKAKAKKVDPEEILQKGREAFFNYEFEEAADLYDEYRTLKSKAKQNPEEEFETWVAELEVASNSFERVQKIVVVDSLSLPADKFYSAYKLSDSSGIVTPYSSIFKDENNNEIAFFNEEKDKVIFPKLNEEGEMRLFEKTKLLDGTWEEREFLEGDFDLNGDYAFPFMSSDGQTFYFANNGEDSMGGYDLFIAQKDALTDEFRQPLNLGMPFNSPYDDLLFAIDEENGLGWWATDRNSLENKITVYVFLYEDVRKNYPSDTENLIDLAKITSFKDTWTDDDYQPITPAMPIVNPMEKQTRSQNRDFVFPLGNGKVYYSYSDFRNRKASDLMKQYVNKKKELEKKEKSLWDMRSQYKTNKGLNERIIQGEEEIENLRAQTKALKNDILKLEKSVR